MGLRHQIPSEFTDEDRWFKFFTKTTMKYLIAGLVITYLLFKLFGLIGFSLIGVTIGLVITIGLVFIASYPIPETQYIKGANLTIVRILKRRLIRYFNRCIYVKGYRGGGSKK